MGSTTRGRSSFGCFLAFLVVGALWEGEGAARFLFEDIIFVSSLKRRLTILELGPHEDPPPSFVNGHGRSPLSSLPFLTLLLMKRKRSLSLPLSLSENLINATKERNASGRAKAKVEASGFVEIPVGSQVKFVRSDVPKPLSFATLSLPRNKGDLDVFFQIFPKSLIRKIALRNMPAVAKPKKIVNALRLALVGFALNIKIRLEGLPSQSEAITYEDETKFLRTAINSAISSLRSPGQKNFGVNKIGNFFSECILLDEEVKELNTAFLKCVSVRTL